MGGVSAEGVSQGAPRRRGLWLCLSLLLCHLRHLSEVCPFSVVKGKLPQTGASTAEVSSLTGLVKLLVVLVPSEAARPCLVPAPSPAAGGLLAIRGGPWLVEASRGHLSSSSQSALPVSVSVSKSPRFIRTQSYWIRAHRNDFILI